MNLNNLNLVELNAQEVKEVEGGLTIFGFTIVEVTGVLDGIPDNTHGTLLGFKLW